LSHPILSIPPSLGGFSASLSSLLIALASVCRIPSHRELLLYLAVCASRLCFLFSLWLSPGKQSSPGGCPPPLEHPNQVIRMYFPLPGLNSPAPMVRSICACCPDPRLLLAVVGRPSGKAPLPCLPLEGQGSFGFLQSSLAPALGLLSCCLWKVRGKCPTWGRNLALRGHCYFANVPGGILLK
jgi:hypothetical protein